MDDSTPDIQAALDHSLARIDELEAENARLRERLQKLEHKLGQNSSNFHRPPSTDDPWEEAPGEDPKEAPGDADGSEDTDSEGSGQHSSRRQGAQPGHEGRHRGLLDEEEVGEPERQVVEVKPSECSSCGAHLRGVDKTPWRHQVFDVEVTRHVTEYQMHRLDCEECGRSERVALPEGACKSAFGDSVWGWISWLGGKFDLSKPDLGRFVEQGF